MSLCLFTVVPGAEPRARHRVDQGGEVALFWKLLVVLNVTVSVYRCTRRCTGSKASSGSRRGEVALF